MIMQQNHNWWEKIRELIIRVTAIAKNNAHFKFKARNMLSKKKLISQKNLHFAVVYANRSLKHCNRCNQLKQQTSLPGIQLCFAESFAFPHCNNKILTDMICFVEDMGIKKITQQIYCIQIYSCSHNNLKIGLFPLRLLCNSRHNHAKKRN